MEHRGFVIEPFERKPGRWRARISHADGRAVSYQGKTHDRYETRDYPSSASALAAAKSDIDFGTLR